MARPKIMIDVYDLIDGKTYSMSSVEFKFKYKTHRNHFSNLRLGKMPCIERRLILASRKDELIKVVKSIKTGKEYECFDRGTFILHMNGHIDFYEKMSISLVIREKAMTCSVGDDVFFLKKNEDKLYIRNFCKVKNSHLFKPEIEQKDIARKIAGAIRGRIRSCLMRRSFKKTLKSEQYIGCTFEFLLGYLEAMFQDGMTWENHGKGKNDWQIDHIIPVNTFDLANNDERMKCFHYTNLRPLWAKDNWRRPDDGSDLI